MENIQTDLRRKTGIQILALVLVLTVFFLVQLSSLSAVLFRPGGRYTDLLITFWPNITYLIHELGEAGRLPLWRTLIFSGSPLDPDPQGGLWYLPNLIFLFLPTGAGFNLLFLLHAVLGGIGMLFWTSRRGLSPWGSFFAALAFALMPRAYAHLGFGHVGLYYAVAYIPWVLWSGEEMGRGRGSFAGVFGIGLGWQIIAHMQIAFFTGLTAGVLFLQSLIRSRNPAAEQRVWNRLAWGAAGSMLALGISAVQWIPLLRFAPLSSRAQLGEAGGVVTSLPPRYLWGLLVADHRGFMDYLLYVGIPVLALALISLFIQRRWVWGGFLLLAILYALGEHTAVYKVFQVVFPFQSWLRAPTRIWLPAGALLAFMAGEGLDLALDFPETKKKTGANLAVAGSGFLALCLVGGYAVYVGTPPRNFLLFGVITVLSAVILFLSLNQRLSPAVSSVIFLTLLLGDLWVVDSTLIEGRPHSDVFDDHPLAEYIEENAPQEPYRVYSPSYSLPRHLAAEYGIETADGVDPLYLADYDRFMQAASGVPRSRYGVALPAMEGDGDVTQHNRKAVPDADLLGALNVYYVAAAFPLRSPDLVQVARIEGAYLYRNEAYLPRAYVVGRGEVAEDFSEALTWVKTHDLSTQTVVEDGVPVCSMDLDADVQWRQNTPNQLELAVKLNKNGILVLSQVWYPDWRAVVNGEPRPLFRVNGVLTGLYLGPGDHQVTLRYRPQTLWVGAGFSLWGLVIAIGLIVWQNRWVRTSIIKRRDDMN